jgi:hypothetical protein
MEQRAVIRFLTLEGLRARAIATELGDVYHPDALALPTVKKWRKRFVQGRTSLSDDPRSGRSLTNDLVAAIASMLKERPFASCKVLSQHFRIVKATCLQILHDNLAMKKFNLRWAPYAWDANQKTERVTLSHELLAVLETSHPTGFQNIITGDESWFFLYYPRSSIWAHSREEVPERLSQKIDWEKCLVSILWSVTGIRSLVDVPRGTAYNSAFLCEIIVPSLVDGICSHSRRKSLKGLYLHLDNALPHIIRGAPLNVFAQQKSNECLTRLRAQTWHQATSSSLVF